jgi:hypothetical protein
MKNLKDRNQQYFGHKRVAKVLKRKQKKRENLAYVSKLMFKYGPNLTLKTRPKPGEKYLQEYLKSE